MKLSELLKDENFKKCVGRNISTCCSCGKEITKGGMWSMNSKLEVSICKECSGQLLDWYIDVLRDVDELDNASYDVILERLKADITNRFIHQKVQLARVSRTR